MKHYFLNIDNFQDDTTLIKLSLHSSSNNAYAVFGIDLRSAITSVAWDELYQHTISHEGHNRCNNNYEIPDAPSRGTIDRARLSRIDRGDGYKVLEIPKERTGC